MGNHTTQKQTMTLEEFAQVMGMEKSAVYQAAKEGRLPVPCSRVGARYFIPIEPVQRLLAGQKRRPT